MFTMLTSLHAWVSALTRSGWERSGLLWLAGVQQQQHPKALNIGLTCAHVPVQGMSQKQLQKGAQARLNDFTDRIRNTASVDLSAQVRQSPDGATKCVTPA